MIIQIITVIIAVISLVIAYEAVQNYKRTQELLTKYDKKFEAREQRFYQHVVDSGKTLKNKIDEIERMAKTAETMANTALRDKKPVTHSHIHKHFTKKRKLKTLVPDSAMNQELSTKYNDCF